MGLYFLLFLSTSEQSWTAKEVLDAIENDPNLGMDRAEDHLCDRGCLKRIELRSMVRSTLDVYLSWLAGCARTWQLIPV